MIVNYFMLRLDRSCFKIFLAKENLIYLYKFHISLFKLSFLYRSPFINSRYFLINGMMIFVEMIYLSIAYL